MNRLILYIVIATLATVAASCRPTTETTAPDYGYVRDLGYRHAAKYRQLDKGSTEMERQGFLLNIQALESRLNDEVGEEYAHEFRQAFADSAFSTNN